MTDHRVDFKLAMRRLASTIALITSGDQGQWTGMAATAVISVTADPPTMLIAINKAASIYPVVDATGAFCVNLLGESHHAMVPIFSGVLKGSERFAHGQWHASAAGPPVLADAVASIVCTVTSQFDAGTHAVFIGLVVEISNHLRIDPLLWIDGNLAQTTAHRATSGGLR